MVFVLFFLVIPASSFGGTAYLDVVSEPEGVDIYINGEWRGKTPLTGLEVHSGTVSIKAEKKGYGTASHSFKIDADEVRSIRIPLKKASGGKGREIVLKQDRGSLLIINKLGPVSVYIDGDLKGTGSMNIDKISTGYHDLKVEGFEKQINIYKDYKLKVEISSSGISILNDLEKIRKKEAEKERERLIAQRERERREKRQAEIREKTCLRVILKADWSTCRINSSRSRNDASFSAFARTGNNDEKILQGIGSRIDGPGESFQVKTQCNLPYFGTIYIFISASYDYKVTRWNKWTMRNLWADKKKIEVYLTEGKTTIITATLRNEKISIEEKVALASELDY